MVFSAKCNIYISRLCYDVSVRLSVTEVHWRIIANLGFKFRSHFTAHCGRRAASRRARAGGRAACGRIISRAMLASARSLVESIAYHRTPQNTFCRRSSNNSYNTEVMLLLSYCIALNNVCLVAFSQFLLAQLLYSCATALCCKFQTAA